MSANNSAQRLATAGCLLGGRLLLRLENHHVIAETKLVAADQFGRPGDALTVEQRAVFRWSVVDFTAPAEMHHDRAVAPGNATVGDDHVVVGHAANTVQSGLQRINAVFVRQPELAFGGYFARLFDDGERAALPAFRCPVAVAGQRLESTGAQETSPRAAKLFAAGIGFQMNAVKSRKPIPAAKSFAARGL